ncbi:MAG: phenylalanine--tRNA ligase subunit beta [Bacilli bacterium]
MLLSRNFLNKHIEIKDIDFKELADTILAKSSEYESISKLCLCTNLVVGEILEVKPHPNSNKLNVCKVNIGEKIVQIVCGATNVIDAKKVIVAKVGAVLPDIIINKSTIRDIESNGMICSLVELGIDKNFLDKEDINGIHVLNEDAPVGVDALDYLYLNDYVCEFELTPNRGDLLSVLGFAKEIKAIYGKNLKKHTCFYEKSDESITDKLKVSVKTNKCDKFLIKGINNITVKESSREIKSLLIASGIKPINNIVDISNYLMIEFGIPLHIYDADKIGDILVRNAKKDEKVIALDNNEYTLNEDAIVVTSNDKIISIAGVIGSLESSVTNETKNIIIECGFFDKISVRKTSKKTSRSQASIRFEKGIDFTMIDLELEKACEMISEFGTVLKDTIVYDNINFKINKIKLDYSYINKIIGIKIPIEKIEEILTNLDFLYELNEGIFTITPPSHKMDMTIKEDIIEEIVRIYGYDNIPGIMPSLGLTIGKLNYVQTLLNATKYYFVSKGFNETLTYTLTKKENLYTFGNDANPIKVVNQMSENRQYLRKNILPSLIEVFEYNKKRKNSDLSLFELSWTYTKEGYYPELGILMSGKHISNSWSNSGLKADFFVLKGVIEKYFDYIGLTDRISFQSIENEGLHPYISADIYVDNKKIGFIGKVHPKISKDNLFVCNLNLQHLDKIKVRDIKYKEIAKFPSIEKDFAFIVDKNIESEELIKIIKKTCGRLLTNVYVFDVYEGSNLEENKKSLAFKLTFTDPSKTLTNEEVLEMFNKTIDVISTQFNAILRSN